MLVVGLAHRRVNNDMTLRSQKVKSGSPYQYDVGDVNPFTVRSFLANDSAPLSELHTNYAANGRIPKESLMHVQLTIERL